MGKRLRATIRWKASRSDGTGDHVDIGYPGRSADPFIGLVEAAVVQAFRQTDLPLQRIRAALEVLEGQGELEPALASRKLMTDGADVLYDYARETANGQLGLLTVVKSGQRVYTDMIAEYRTPCCRRRN